MQLWRLAVRYVSYSKVNPKMHIVRSFAVSGELHTQRHSVTSQKN